MRVQQQSKSKIPLLGDSNNSLVLLIAINALLFIILNGLKVIYLLSYDNINAEVLFQKQILQWFVLPANTESLFNKPWVIFSYMFSHYSVWGLITTCLWLWAFGYILQDLTGNNKLIPLYIYGGFIGAVFFLLSIQFIPAFQNNLQPFIGGSAAVMCVAVAATTLAPDYRIFPMLNGGIPLWVLTVIFAAIDFGSIAKDSSSQGLAHLMAGAFGFIFIKQLRKGNDWSKWMNNFINWINDLFNPEKKYNKQNEKEKLFYKSEGKPYSKKANLTQKKLDEILDKINKEGYHMLSDEEKEFLTRASNEEL
ncbi:MAG: rhomboid family intramembrane serine protease [Bacteroidetes bacterium]|nr:rhomboid family intramembrane serine protease [Bacteroidota bacterium]MBS1648950.1 rhomboid family intramembrane serine protease [Bacteroidota bacterium]